MNISVKSFQHQTYILKCSINTWTWYFGKHDKVELSCAKRYKRRGLAYDTSNPGSITGLSSAVWHVEGNSGLWGYIKWNDAEARIICVCFVSPDQAQQRLMADQLCINGSIKHNPAFTHTVEEGYLRYLTPQVWIDNSLRLHLELNYVQW